MNTVAVETAPSRPFLKWVGGKTRLLPKILPYVPDLFENYYEPFLGGGAMYFAVRDRLAGIAHLHDLNGQLINVWQQVQAEPRALFEAMEYYASNDSKEFYYQQRLITPESQIEQAARVIYLNQTCWNGLWRVNKWGQFNVPWGQRAFRGIPFEILHSTSALLTTANITSEDFRDTLSRPQSGDFVYLDPPYLPISETSKFHLYTERRFRGPDLGELAALCHEMTDRGVHWIMSNRYGAGLRELFPHNEIVSFTARRSVAAQNRRDVEEIKSPEALILSPGIS